MPIIVRLAAYAIALTFLWAATAKVARFGAWRRALAGHGLPAFVEAPALVLVPVVEAGVAALILSGRLLVGAGLALASLATFSLAIARAHRQGMDRLPCGCFGGRETRDAKLLVTRNALLAVPVAIVLVHGKDHDIFDGVGAPTSGEAAAAVSVIIGIVLIAWLLNQASASFRHRERA